jgi:nucleoside-diphosphate-sugar epimerase
VRGERFTCPIKAGTRMDMMYMPDALRAAIQLMEADPTRLVHHNGFNVAAMSFDPDMIFHAIKKLRPEFEMDYDIDPLKQSIADSWPDMMDDSCARREWGWQHQYNLTDMTADMLDKLSKRLNGGKMKDER